ncbi:hypothetical protein RFI_23533 [Reticulomyxa filosa]|uniref:Anaphase-promoting complex subunit 4-like WD40 domain-containing protein n=1 Tax=Reticulomyxa filosa TaxID=46433 RepID=X6MJL2_RETFI|nr:hypothetical protein RFI_23533 [Reticulomyxa filosa]|eukprot:ETO13836.1 hypothetical protein RFI_23533 [Reticulomyxa filosa]
MNDSKKILFLFENCKKKNKKRLDEGTVNSVKWLENSGKEFVSVGDDKTIINWNIDEDEANRNILPKTNLFTLPQVCMSFSWCPGQQFAALGTTDGSLLFYNSSQGKITKQIESAHLGAVICVQWNKDGSALVTGGEDGVIKQWSRTGNLRSRLVAVSHLIYDIDWSPSDHAVVYCFEKYVAIQPIQGHNKPIKWKAHASAVLALDWNAQNQLIVTGGEDCCYRVWDEYGRMLYSSSTFSFPCTSVGWAPNGKYFAVGSHNLLLFCDRLGWIYNQLDIEMGSIMSVQWSRTNMDIIAGAGNGQLCVGTVTGKCIKHKQWEITQASPCELHVANVLESETAMGQENNENGNILHFNAPVVDFLCAQFHLIALTSAMSCQFYDLKNLDAPAQTITSPSNNYITLILATQTCAFFCFFIFFF